jgi:hypothetical protein
VNKISEKGIPCCIYNRISEADKFIKNFSSASFLLIDWEMESTTEEHSQGGVVIGEALKEQSEKEVIAFIKKFKEITFAPIFIFSVLDPKTIEQKLIDNELFTENKKNIIYIENKSKLAKRNNLFTLINKWIKENPAVYILKKWDSNFVESKNTTFNSLFDKSPVWPKILWKTSEVDSVDPTTNINDIIFRIIKSKTSLNKIDSKVINKRSNDSSVYEEIKDVLIDTMYIHKTKLDEDDVAPGDIFKIKDYYYINITPECDTVIGRTKQNKMNLYLLKATEMTKEGFKKDNFHKKFGITERINQVILYGIENKDMFSISLKKITTLDYFKIKDNRICRLLPPHSIYLQQKFSSYISRIGRPRIPEIILKKLP